MERAIQATKRVQKQTTSRTNGHIWGKGMSESNSNQETVHLIKSVSSLMQSLSHRDLESDDVAEALRQLKKSAGFKKIIGTLSSVHVVNFGQAEAPEGTQRLRKRVNGDHGVISIDGYILQVCKNGKWIDATENDLP